MLYYLIGIIGLNLPLTQSLFEKLVPLSLLISIGLLAFYHKDWSLRFLAGVSVIWVLSFLIEVAGVSTAAIFGQYFYGSGLGPKVFGTPLLIGINWLILVYSVFHMLKEKLKGLSLIFTAALILVIFDIALEPVAVHFSWWIWPTGYVPLQNYFAWYLTSALLLFIMMKSGPQHKNPLAGWILITQFVFFLILNLVI
ncbi:MAG: carotenoid biosynthesis protein [Bacteroidales bacterium]